MPQIFDNIQQSLLPVLKSRLEEAYRADFCVGYFNLRGWRELDSRIEQWIGGDDYCCRLLIGMQRHPEDELLAAFGRDNDTPIDNQRATQLKRDLAESFRHQLTVGVPTNSDEAGLQRLARQLKAGKVVVKLFLRHPLHAKLLSLIHI